MQRSLFLSYSSADRVHAEHLAALLRTAELPVVCSSLGDASLGDGEFWAELDRTIQCCDVFIALCGAQASSPAALAELGAAVARLEQEPGFPIVPAFLGQLDVQDVPAPLRAHQYIVLPQDLLNASDAEREEVVRQFRGLIRVKQERSADVLWQRAAERIAAHLEYHGMVLRPQAGLVPLGRDPDSHLEEFWVMGTGAPVQRAANGRLSRRDDGALVLVLAPGGEFEMGASDRELQSRVSLAEEHPRRRVRIATHFVAKTPVNQLQFACVMGWSRSKLMGPTLPAADVTWNEAQVWCSRLGLSLPSEAQWEYDCRARSALRFAVGDREEDLARCGWFAGNTRGAPQPVGLLAPNRFGLHDMHGSVWEWCADGWHGTYVDAPCDGSAWSSADLTHAVARGGCWSAPAALARSANRQAFRVDEVLDTLGFRPVRAVVE